ncbi:MAG TPA: hypothetical protein VGG04_09445 [Candidatus Sulfotelmatobacter sp.]|jgi:hypothetical protein
MTEFRTHSFFEGVALASDGRYLILEYFDPDQGGTRLCFRYTISFKGKTWLASGYGLEPGGVGKEIAYEEIPKDVLEDASHWLKSNQERIRDKEKTLFKILSDYSELLDPEKRKAYLQRATEKALQNQESLKFLS